MTTARVFDGAAMMAALDARRAEHGLDWNRLAVELHAQSGDLNAELCDHGLCQGALVRTALRGTMSCQYALPILRWLGRPPEEFLTGRATDIGDRSLPSAGPDRRLRWNLLRLHAAVDDRRRAGGLTWVRLGAELSTTPGRLSNLRTARLADMELTMQLTQWLGMPAASFVEPARW